MKRIALIVVVVAVVVYVCDFLIPDMKAKRQQEESAAHAVSYDDESELRGGRGGMGGERGDRGGMGGGMRNPLERLKNEEGMIEIAKLDSMKMMDDARKDEMRELMTASDANADGLLDEEEQKVYEEKNREARLEHMFDPLKDGEDRYVLARLEEVRLFPPVVEAAKNADADGDGYLDAEELQNAKNAVAETMKQAMSGGPGMGGPRSEGARGPRPEGMGGPRSEGGRGQRPEGMGGPRSEGGRGQRPEGMGGPRPEDAPAATSEAE